MCKVKHNGVIKDAIPYAKHNGVIKPVREVWGRVNNVLVKLWTAVTVTVFGNFTREVVSGATVRDRGSFGALREPFTLPQPTSYSWDVQDSGGSLIISGGLTGPTLTLIGPQYNQNDFNREQSATLTCEVVIDNQTYKTAERVVTYTAPG